jgi:hypothetical protein
MASAVFDKSERADLLEEDDRGGPGFALEEVHWPSGGLNHHPVSDGEASVTVPSGSGRLTMYGRGSATRTPRGGGKMDEREERWRERERGRSRDLPRQPGRDRGRVRQLPLTDLGGALMLPHLVAGPCGRSVTS